MEKALLEKSNLVMEATENQTKEVESSLQVDKKTPCVIDKTMVKQVKDQFRKLLQNFNLTHNLAVDDTSETLKKQSRTAKLMYKSKSNNTLELSHLDSCVDSILNDSDFAFEQCDYDRLCKSGFLSNTILAMNCLGNESSSHLE